MKLIECRDLCMKYEGVPAFENLTFSVNEGDFLCIVGENGSGKSTLVKGILGLKKVSSGSIEFSSVRPKEIGYLPQQTAAQKDFPATVNEVVLSGCLNRNSFFPFYTRENKERAKREIAKMKIEDIVGKSYRSLSGGQQQRVLLARALCATEKLLLLDEPVSGLDPIVTSEMYEVIGDLNKSGVTVIMVTHDIHNAVHYGNMILNMSKSGYFFGTADDYIKTDSFRAMSRGCFHGEGGCVTHGR
ncbi:MAG: metal ABC transporter ATP-binding protein [Ruminiclostridium sp.]|nr:metal ABC transporter ATP-binding protein [Ruminiclostridium sp.]